MPLARLMLLPRLMPLAAELGAGLPGAKSLQAALKQSATSGVNKGSDRGRLPAKTAAEKNCINVLTVRPVFVILLFAVGL